MVNGGLQIAGYFCGLLSAFFSLIVCAYPEWRKNDLQGQVIETQQVKQGIWWNCMHFATGQWHCDDYDRVLLGLPAELQAARALMVLSNVLGFFGYLLSQFGLSCTRFMEDNPEGKRKLCIAAALCFGLGGVLTGIAVSFYAATVVSDFYATGGMTGVGLSNMGGVNSMQAGNRFIYGNALFLGWLACGLGIVGAVVQICGTTGDDDDDDYRDNYNNAGYNNQAFTANKRGGGGGGGGQTGTEYI